MQQELAQLREENERLKAMHARDLAVIAELEEEIRHHLLARFGKSSEAYRNETLVPLFDEADASEQESRDVEEDQATTIPEHTRVKKRKPALPSILPREQVLEDLLDEEKHCAIHDRALERIGEDISEKLEIEPEKIKVKQFVRPKYKCPCCEGNIQQAPMPPLPIPGSVASASLLAYIIVSKYVDHLPLYRLEQRFARIYVELNRLKMSRWVIQAAELLTPLYNLLEDKLLAGQIIQMDETPVQVLDEKGRAATSNSYMWVRARDGTTGPPIVLFDYDPSRSTTVIQRLLSGYEGILQTDGYASYDRYTHQRAIVHAGCMAHCRRKFWQAYKASKSRDDSFAKQALDYFKAIYKVEAELKDLPLDAKLEQRQARIMPLMAELKTWLDDSINKVPSSLKTGEAMKYLDSQWPKLMHAMNDARIALDTNFVEGKIRPFTLGRKNWLFSKSTNGAHASAMIYSILETAKANGLEPFEYLKNTLDECE